MNIHLSITAKIFRVSSLLYTVPIDFHSHHRACRLKKWSFIIKVKPKSTIRLVIINCKQDHSYKILITALPCIPILWASHHWLQNKISSAHGTYKATYYLAYFFLYILYLSASALYYNLITLNYMFPKQSMRLSVCRFIWLSLGGYNRCIHQESGNLATKLESCLLYFS